MDSRVAKGKRLNSTTYSVLHLLSMPLCLYAFVHYKCFASAQYAIEQLDGAILQLNGVISNNKRLQVLPMRRNCRKLHLELLSVTFTSYSSSASKSFLRNFFPKYGPIASVDDYTHHKGDRFGFITFENPEDAARAARDAPNHTLFNQYFKVSGQYVDVADEGQVDLKQLHVRNLDEAITDYSLKALFFSYGCLLSCKVLCDPNGTSTGSGLVAFSTNVEASRACHAMNGKLILGKRLSITGEERRKSRPEPISVTAMTPTLEEGWKSSPEMQPIPVTAMNPQPPLPLPMHPPLHMYPPGGYGLGFGPKMYPPGGFGLGFGQHMFYGQAPPALFSLEPGYWIQQQLIPSVRLLSGAPIPNTSVPQLFTGMTLGAGSSMPSSSCKPQDLAPNAVEKK